MHREHGQKRRTLLGHYPAITLAQARDKALKLRSRIALQIHNPSQVSFLEALELYRATHLMTMRPKTRIEQNRILSKYWEPHHHKPLSLLGRAEIARTLDGLSDTPVMARNARSALRTFLNWGNSRDYCNPFPRGLQKPKTTTRSRTLTDAELTAIWNACENDSFGYIVRLLLLTGQRRGEITALQSDWISDNSITFPPHITKNGQEHTIPLAPMTLFILGHREDLNPVPRFTKSELHRKSFDGASNSNLLFPSSKTGMLINGWTKLKAALDKRSGVTDWTLHDLRRTFSTKLAELGIAPHVVERCLNHQTGAMTPIAKRYNRYQYQAEMKLAFDTYDAHISRILASSRLATDKNTS